jgi:hypothetical protein
MRVYDVLRKSAFDAYADDESEEEKKDREDWEKRGEDARKRFGRDESEEDCEEREKKESAEDARKRMGRDESEEEQMEREANDKRARDARMAHRSFMRARDAAMANANDRGAFDKMKKAFDALRMARNVSRRGHDRAASGLDMQRGKDIKARGGNDKMTKQAMDAAIEARVAKGIAEERQRALDVREAERFVRPLVGDLRIACDTAADVYREALAIKGVDVTDVHPSAFRTLLDHLPRGGDSLGRRLATDRAATKSWAERFPDAARIEIM